MESKYKVVLHRNAAKNLKKIPHPWKQRIIEAIEILEEDAFYGVKLWGDLKNCRKIRIWPYRIIYTIKIKEKLVYILNIDHRQNIY